MDSRSGPAEVLRQETYVVARLLGAVDLERQAEEGLSIRAIHHREAGYKKGCQCEWSGGGRLEFGGSGFQPLCSLWLPRTLWFSSMQPSGAQQ